MTPTDRIVRFAVLSAAMLAAGAFLVVMVASPHVRIEPAERDYWGARILPPGPAPDGLPIIPVRVAADGTLHGLPSHLGWYRYNGGEDLAALREDHEGNDTFYAAMHPNRLVTAERQGVSLWWEPLLGKPLRATDFTEDGSAAPAAWRSPGAYDEHGQMHVWVMRVDASVYPREVREEFAPDGFIAFAARSTHHGCTVGFAMADDPRALSDAGPVFMDPCHDSRYDPREIRRYEMPPGE